MNQVYNLIAKYGKVMSSETKVAVLHALASGEKRCRDIYKFTGLSGNSVQSALGDLEKQGFVAASVKNGLKHYHLTKPNQTLDFMNNLGLFANDIEKVS